MNDMSHDVRSQTMALIDGSLPAGINPQVPALIGAWLGALDQDDLAGTAPASLAPALLDGFAQAATRNAPGCQIATIVWSDGRGENATALLVLNDDMPYLVDWVGRHYRDRLEPGDLADPAFAIECSAALTELERLLDLPGLYDLS